MDVSHGMRHEITGTGVRSRFLIGGWQGYFGVMPRRARFDTAAGFAALDQVLVEVACKRVPLQIFGYTLMGNHGHICRLVEAGPGPASL